MSMRNMLKWGGVKFHSKGPVFDSLTRTRSWEWAELERFGQEPALQFTGTGVTTLTLEGTIKTLFGGVSNAVGIKQLKTLEAEADKKIPLPMITGLGQVLGLWVCSELSETNTDMLDNGAFLSQPFSVSFKKYQEDEL